MPRPRKWPPTIHPDPLSGQDRVRIYVGGKPRWRCLGPIGSAKAHEAYARLLLAGPELLPAGPPETMTVAVLVALYLDKEGPALDRRELWHQERAAQALCQVHGRTRIADFGPRALEEVRDALIAERPLSARYANRLIMRIRRMWRWAAEREYIKEEAVARLLLLRGLRQGDRRVRHPGPVEDVPPETVEATLPWLLPIPAAMVRLQVLTGARPGEVCGLCPGDIDRKGIDIDRATIWIWRTSAHKRQAVKPRWIALGPRAQELLLPYLDRPADKPCFSPLESRLGWERQKRERRQSRVQPSQADRRKAAPRKGPGERYTPSSFGKAVLRGIRAAARAGVVIQRWHPHQLRHSAATLVQEEMGIDAARAMLGHDSADVTVIYSHADLRIAAKAAAKFG